jgi:hypothetical protein
MEKSMRKGNPGFVSDELVDKLEKYGFTAQVGSVNKADIFTFVDFNGFPNCFDNNATALYMKLNVPPPPNRETPYPPILTEVEIPFDENHPKQGLLVTKSIEDPRFRLAGNEAVILFGTTPGESKYYSFCPYIYERYYEEDLKFREVFNSLNDPINNKTIKTIESTAGNSAEEQSPFNAFAAFVFVADGNTKDVILQCLAEYGWPEDLINVSVIPSEILRLGIDFEDDILMILFRIYGADKSFDLDAYVNDVPMGAIRVTPNESTEPKPLSMPQLRVRGTGKTEMDLMPTMEQLREAILSRYEQDGWKATEYTTDQWLEEGIQALQANRNMYGECRDTAYMSTKSFTMYDNEFIVMYGVDHTKTGKAAYCSAAVYGEDYQNGVTGSNSLEWGGSADEYLDELGDTFFVLTASRNHGLPDSGPDCVVPTTILTRGIQKFKPVFAGFRNYLEAATKSGPVPEEMISPRVIKFSKPAYPPVL